MKKINYKIKRIFEAAIVIAIVSAFVMPGAAVFTNEVEDEDPDYRTNGHILLVDSDYSERYTNCDDYLSWYVEALDACEYSYTVWNRYLEGCPSVETMLGYEAVIWFTGDLYGTDLMPSSDRSILIEYLESGGRFFISSSALGFQLGQSSLHQEYLHAEYLGNNWDLDTLEGVSGDPIGDGLSFTLEEGTGANQRFSQAEISPIAPATSVFVWHPGYFNGDGAIKTDINDYKTVYFSFGFECISYLDDRTEVMRRTIEWLIVEPPQAPTAYIDSVSPNPATLGERVTFVGHGDDSDGYIIGYNWRSSIDGLISIESAFNRLHLSVGTHTIYFKVQDNDELWSEEVEISLEIRAPEQQQYGWQWEGFDDTGLSHPYPYWDPYVGAFTEYENELIVGGWFTDAGDVEVNNIARWNGNSWNSCGSGTDGTVYALTEYDGDLIAGGGFFEAGGIAVNHIARWDGASWHPLGSGIQGGSYPEVYAFTIYNGDLIAGGNFDYAGGETANSIARWDGSSWHPMGPQDNPGFEYGCINALTVYNGELIAAGSIYYAGGNEIHNIARWDEDTQEWTALDPNDPLGSGTVGWNDCINTLCIYNGDLVAGGYFCTTTYAQHIARWDGSTWHPMRGLWLEGYDGFEVYSVTVFNNKLIAGGLFDIAGGYPDQILVNYIARWNGIEWNSLGYGMAEPRHPEYQHASVYEVCVYDNSLFAGGNFQNASGQPTKHIARWYYQHPPCFLSGTVISMADRSSKNIEDIKVGDKVIAYDEHNRQIVSAKVTATFHHSEDEMGDYYLIINGNIRVTPNHPLFVNGKWVEAGDIQIGDMLLGIQGNPVEVQSLEKISNRVPTYNFEVETYHNYFAEGILAHNKPVYELCEAVHGPGEPPYGQ